MIGPTWAQGAFPQVGGEDHLGLLSVGISIADWLLPGITSVTNRARYYSFYSWVLLDYIECHYNRTDVPFLDHLRRREAAFVLANVSTPEGGNGIVGVNQATEVWNSGQDPIGVKRGFVQERRGGYPVYRNAMSRCNLTTLVDSDTCDALQPAGQRAGEAFRKAIEHTEYYREFLEADELPRRVICEYGRAAAAGMLSSSLDGTVLRDTFFRTDSQAHEIVQRRETLAYLLSLFAQPTGMSTEDLSFAQAMYYGTLPDGSQASVPIELESIAEGWEIYWLRQYMAFALETLWGHFLEQIRRTSMSESEFLEAVLKEAEVGGQSGRAWGLSVPRLAAPLGEWLDWATDAVSQGEIEAHIFSLIRGRHVKYVSSYYHVRLPLALLFCLYARRGCETKCPENSTLIELGGNEHKSIGVVFDQLRHFDSATPAGELVRQLYRKFIWLQHREVALTKLVVFGYDTFRFVEQDGLFHFMSEDYPKLNVFRVRQATQMLNDFGLIKQQNGRYYITPAGRNVMGEVVLAAGQVDRRMPREVPA